MRSTVHRTQPDPHSLKLECKYLECNIQLVDKRYRIEGTFRAVMGPRRPPITFSTEEQDILEGSCEELQALGKKLQNWTRSIKAARLCVEHIQTLVTMLKRAGRRHTRADGFICW